MADQLKEGVLPLWNPYHSSGTPMAADDFTWGIYYPGMIFHMLWPGFGFTLEAIVHLCLSFYFLRKLLKHYGASDTGSFFGAITFLFSASITTLFYAGDINVLYAACWLPATFYFASLYATEGRGAGALVIVLSLQILCGHPEIIFFTAAFTFIFIFVLSPGRRLRLFGLFAFPLGIAAIHLLPVGEVFYSQAVRSQYWSFQSASEQSFPLGFVFSLITPYLFGKQAAATYWGPPFDYLLLKYIGIVPWMLVIFAFARWRQQSKMIKVMLILMCISLFMAFGRGSGFSQFADFVPIVRGFSVPANLMVYVAFFGSIIAALQWEYLREAVMSKITLCLLLFSMIGFCLVYFDLFAFHDSLAAVSLDEKRRVALLESLQTWVILSALILGLKLSSRRFITLGIQILCLIFYASSWIRPTSLETYVSPEKWKIVKADNDIFRVFEHVSLPLVDKPVLNQDFSQGASDGIYFHVFRLQGATTTLSLARYHEYKAYLNFGEPPVQDRFFHLTNIDSKFLNYSNVKYLISAIPVEDPQWKFVGRTSFYNYTYRDYRPRARIYNEFFVEQEPLKMLQRMTQQEGLYLEHGAVGKHVQPAVPGIIKWLTYTPNKMELETSSHVPSYLFLSEIYNPGWRATIDDHAVKIEKANFVFRAVELPSGVHRIKMWYRPDSWVIGLWISLFSLVLLVLFWNRL